MAQGTSCQPLARVAGLQPALTAAGTTSATADAMQTGGADAGNGSPGGGETAGIHCPTLSRDTRFVASARRRGGCCRGLGGCAGPHPSRRWRCVRSAVNRQRHPAVQVDSAVSATQAASSAPAGPTAPGGPWRRWGPVASRGRVRQPRRDAVARSSTQRRAVGRRFWSSPSSGRLSGRRQPSPHSRPARLVLVPGRVCKPHSSFHPPRQTPYVVCPVQGSCSVPSRHPALGEGQAARAIFLIDMPRVGAGLTHLVPVATHVGTCGATCRISDERAEWAWCRCIVNVHGERLTRGAGRPYPLRSS